MSSWNKNLFKEGQMSGALSNRLAQLYDLVNETGYQTSAPLSVDPGDWISVGDDQRLSLSLPIAYDIWYLWHTVNLLVQEEQIKLDINPIFGTRIKPSILRTALNPPDGFFSWEKIPTLEFFRESAIFYIKEMRFETFLADRSPFYISPGPRKVISQELDHEGSGLGDLYAGYLAFPVGPLGVMRVQSLISFSLLDGNAPENNSEDPIEGEELLPPMIEQSDDCMGRRLVSSTYNIIDTDTEYPAEHMDGTESVLPHHWMRYWLPVDGQFPVPGEFVGLVCKAQSVPSHCWWYQRTNPFVYAGNFFETEYYTSGIILAIIEEQDRKENYNGVMMGAFKVTELSWLEQRTGYGEHKLSMGDEFKWEKIGTVYKVRVKNQDLYLRCTDFAKYKLDSRVAIRKSPGLKTKNFTWDNLIPGRRVPGESVAEKRAYDLAMSGRFFEINTDWVIVPITFYE